MNEDLEDKPSFDEVAEEFLEFVDGSTLVIHNAAFDIGFLNNELKLASSKYPKLEDICEVEDSLAIAKDKFPGQRNSLDALASRFDISNYDRTFHGALLDANILADVYMMLTGGQSKFEFSSNSIAANNQNPNAINGISKDGLELKLIQADKHDLDQHESRLLDIEERNSIKALWRELH
jgi:DNA polymerase-3 subunit epsilon